MQRRPRAEGTLLRNLRSLLLAAMLVATAPVAAHAISITASIVPPTPGSPMVGQSVFVDVAIDGLGLLDAPSLTGFDIDLSFDPSVVSFSSLSFPPLAGLTSCTPATYTAACEAFSDSSVSGNIVNFAVASFFSPATINANQATSGSLALLEFLVVGDGAGAFAFANVDLSGTIVGTTEGVLSASATGTSIVAAVPEPGTAILLLLGLIGTAARRNSSAR